MKKFGYEVKLNKHEKKEGVLQSTINAVLLKLGMKEKIETNLKATLAENKGTVLFDSEELAVGSVVFMEAEGGRTDLPDGEYTLEDGRKFVVEAGAVKSMTELQAETKEVEKAEEAKADQAADVQMALVNKIIELSNEKSEAKVETIKQAVAAELSKIPVVTPMAAPKAEVVVLSKQEIQSMGVTERAQHFANNLIKLHGQPRQIKLASGEPTITTTYAGNFALPYIGAALLSGDTLANGNVTIKQGVPLSGQKVKVLALGDNMKSATCDFTHSGTVTLTERVLTPIDLQVQMDLCKNDFLLDWEQDKMGAGRAGKSLPPNFSCYLLMRIAAKNAAAVENKIWKGAAGADSFEGFEAKLTTITALGAAAPTAANVVGKLRLITAAIPQAHIFNSDFKLYCSSTIVQAYYESQNDAGIQDLYNTAGRVMRFDGYELIHAPGMTAGSVIGATKENLWFGTDMMSDHASAKVLDMEPLDLSNNVRVSMKFTAGTQIGILADCVHGTQS